MQFDIPMPLILFRVILTPFFVLVFCLPITWSLFAAALIFCIAAVTDWLDGFLIRHWSQSARSDAFLDPVADRVLVAITMVLVAEHYHSWWAILPAVTVIVRGVIISVLYEWMVELGKRSSVVISWIGKVKTIAQMVALTWLPWHPSIWIEYAGIALLFVATVLAPWSMLQYLSAAYADLPDQWSFRYNFQQAIKSGEKYC